MKLTGWYPSDQKPVRVGWYEVNAFGVHAKLYWSDGLWFFEFEDTYISLTKQNWEWRGIAK